MCPAKIQHPASQSLLIEPLGSAYLTVIFSITEGGMTFPPKTEPL